MSFIPADLPSVILFSLFTAAMYILVLFAIWKTQFRFVPFLLGFDTYLLGFCAVVFIGAPLKWPIPVVPILFFSVILGAFALGLSEWGRRIALGNSLAVLIGFQGFRLPLELILHHWADLGTVPPTMTWTGNNYDIVTGVASLMAIPFVNKSKNVAWIVQLLGFGLLMNVMYVVVMSTAMPFAWPLENQLWLIGYLPYALIAPLFVGVALAGHIITFRKLKSW